MNPQRKRRGFSVHVFLPNGDPDGLKVVEKDNWTGRGLVMPRAMFAETRNREELNRTGVYLLIGPSNESSLRGKGFPARRFETAEGFVVVKGSQSPAAEVPSTPQSIVAMRSELRKNGVLAVQGDHLVFTQDYAFGSPSTAAAVCMARNGRVEWKDAQSRSLREMQEQVQVETDA